MTSLIVNFARRVGGANHRCQMGVNWTTLLSSDTGHRTPDTGQWTEWTEWTAVAGLARRVDNICR